MQTSLASVNNVIIDERVNIVTPDSRWMETWMETPRRAIGTKVRGVRSFVHEGISGSTKSQGTVSSAQRSFKVAWECPRNLHPLFLTFRFASIGDLNRVNRVRSYESPRIPREIDRLLFSQCHSFLSLSFLLFIYIISRNSTMSYSWHCNFPFYTSPAWRCVTSSRRDSIVLL